MKRFLFLDVDGVLNSDPFLTVAGDKIKKTAGEKFDFYNDEFRKELVSPDMVALVNQLVDRTGAQIVLSSSWRRMFANALESNRFFRKVGLKHPIIAHTPAWFSDRPRGREIQAWLDHTNNHDSSIVILDDNTDMQHLMHRLVQTSFATGITQHDVDFAVALFAIIDTAHHYPATNELENDNDEDSLGA